ncbi:hypothetical protein C8R47DRAFT_1216192 [Mycena vitilis]|nr:hypothetical protein C8R47DRAFT_1216192 [Mycena vitilis]
MDHLELTLGSSTRLVCASNGSEIYDEPYQQWVRLDGFAASLVIHSTGLLVAKSARSETTFIYVLSPLVYVALPENIVMIQNASCDAIDSKSAGATLRSPNSSSVSMYNVRPRRCM